MKSKINFNKHDYSVIAITLAAGLFIGWLFFHHSRSEGTPAQAVNTNTDQVQEKTGLWTCSMHPQIRMDHPGKCPICGMDLIPVKDDQDQGDAISPDEIQMTDDAMKIADVQTMVVKKAYPEKNVYLLGKVRPDERNIAELTARFGGRIEKLFVNFTGQNVKKGEKLATIYSPTMMTAQKELLEAMKYKKSNPDLYRASRSKLKLWDLTDAQIDNIEKEGTPQSYFDVLSPIEGTVTKRNVALGDYVKEGTSLFQVIDLTKIWVMFDAYESDLPWIRLGDKVTFTVQSIPGKTFTGRISFIDPTIDPKTRVAQVRVETRNPDLTLKPEMFANGTVTSSIAGNSKDILVPKTAILWTGKRAVVYVKDPTKTQPVFSYRQVVLGPEAGDFYVIDSGLKEGEEIAVNGVFKIDAAAQLAGKPSMMNPEGGSSGAGSMPGMNMSGEKKTSMTIPLKQTSQDKKSAPIKFKQQLTGIYLAYLKMKNAFVASDVPKVKDAATNVNKAIGAVDMELLKGDAHIAWKDQLKTLKSTLASMEKLSDIEKERAEFADFSLTLYHSLKAFGLSNQTAYYQYCPMAFNQKGAFWISETNKIQNPYFGEAMIDCGETKETLN